MRRRRRPERHVGAEVVISRPGDGTAVVLSPVTAIIWDALDDWTTEAEAAIVLADRFPDVAADERREALVAALALLTSEDLIERAAR